MKRIIIFVSIFWTLIAHAQFSTVDLPGSQKRTIQSKIVNQEYELNISFPRGYDATNKKLPVAYVMDSQWDFALVRSLYGQQYYDGFLPEMIIVGVTWGGARPNHDSLRARDYTPTNGTPLPQSGGADKFLAFMKQELIPFIEANYKADPANRVLMGCSFGGLFTLFALFTEPELFKGYIAASPAVLWDRASIYNYERKYFESKTAAKGRLYMTIGDVERQVPDYEKFAEHLASRNYGSLEIRSKVLDNTGHSGTKGETYARGLQFVFERPILRLPPTVLSKYAGRYQGGVEVRAVGDQLMLIVGGNRYTLFAASETNFYSNQEYLRLSFQGDVLTLERWSGTQTLTKTK